MVRIELLDEKREVIWGTDAVGIGSFRSKLFLDMDGTPSFEGISPSAYPGVVFFPPTGGTLIITAKGYES